MKKVKKILMVVLLFVVTLNINYLGMMEKKVIVTSKEYKEGNTNNLVLNKILSDNELKQEIPHMFNYPSNGMQDGADEVNPEYITNGLYSSSDEDGTTYYYRGDIDNNNIIFGAYDEDYYVYGNTLRQASAYYQSKESCMEAEDDDGLCIKTKIASAGDKIYWKIVRVNGDGSLRLFYNGSGFSAEGGIGSGGPNSLKLSQFFGVIGIHEYKIEHIALPDGSKDPKYTGYTYDNGTASFIKKEVDTWYNNVLGSNSTYDSKVILGRYCSDSSGYNYDVFGRFSSWDRLRQAWNDFAKDNAPTFICPTTSESYGGAYRLKAGLITADELAFAGEMDSSIGSSYLNTGEDGVYYWSMTPVTNTSVMISGEALTYSDISLNKGIGLRPVINVSTENMTLTGDGTIDNPYILEEVVPTNSYKGKVTIEVGSSVDDNIAFEEALDLSNVTWTSKDESIAKIENGKIIGLKNGTIVITGVGSDGTTYEIEVTVISNPVTNSALYIGIGIALILIFSTCLYIFYRKVVKISE